MPNHHHMNTILDWAPCPFPTFTFLEFQGFVRSLNKSLNIGQYEIEYIARRCGLEFTPSALTYLPTSPPNITIIPSTQVTASEANIQSASTTPIVLITTIAIAFGMLLAVAIFCWLRRKKNSYSVNSPSDQVGLGADPKSKWDTRGQRKKPPENFVLLCDKQENMDIQDAAVLSSRRSSTHSFPFIDSDDVDEVILTTDHASSAKRHVLDFG